MLLIGDIHITTKVKSQICDSLNAFVDGYPDEQHIVLVGDFVYHFSYDRGALMQLYGLLVHWYQQGKTIYVLAGNHDRLGSHFVYDEAKTAFDLLNQHSTNKLYFITNPACFNIEGKQVFFLPYMLDISVPVLSDQYDSGVYQALKSTIDELLLSSHAGEQLSGKINAVLLDAISRYGDELLVIHHYYIAQTVFPGLRSQFGYKDVALSPVVLQLDSVRFISGHLHQPFVCQNYLCIGSRWHTSSLETQHYKITCQFDLGTNVLNINYHHINPYIVLPLASDQHKQNYLFDSPDNTPDDTTTHQQSALSRADVMDVLSTIDLYMHDLMRPNSHWDIRMVEHNEPALDLLTLTIQTSKSTSYQDIDALVDESFRQMLCAVNIKKISSLELQELNLSHPGMSLIGWQEVLLQYIRGKYPETHQRYEDMLRSLQVIS